ncbi:phage major capsid protein, P2 family [Oceanospirillaceae bacterium ASx5O]|nr:phage major capsid protein, P2 family [Oceanospirillaceae bacterium ASx5O]
MKKNTRLMFEKLNTAMAKAYGVEDITKKFAVDIPQETKLNDAIQASDAFLQMITMQGVEDSNGQALQLGVSGMLAKRTDVSTDDRTPAVMGGPNGTKWEAVLTEFDIAIPYQLLDAWARYPDFYQRYMKAVYRQIALDRMQVGWYGESAATETNATTYPLGQDVNIGWLKTLATENPSQYMKKSGAVADKIYIGAAGDYKNIDALAYDLYAGIPVEHRTGNEVVIVGSALVADDTNKGLTRHAQTPSEKTAGVSVLTSTYGGLPSIQVPKFPDMGMVVVDPANLHLYFQEGKTRRYTKENPERNRVVDFISSNDAYAIGNVKAMAAVHAANVEFKES